MKTTTKSTATPLSPFKRPRAGTHKEKCFDHYLRTGSREATVALGVKLGLQATSVQSWLSGWRHVVQPPRTVQVKTARARVDRRTVPGRRIREVYLARGADACLAMCERVGITRRAMLLTLAAIEHRRTAQ